MMKNKWVQAACLGGVAVGIWVGGWVALLHPMANFIVPIPVGLASLWVTANARGTNGWGGPYDAP